MSQALNFFSNPKAIDVHRRRLEHATHPQSAENGLVSKAQKAGIHNGDVLDVCAGGGAVSKVFTAHGYHCHAVDGSAEMITLCQTHLPADRTSLINLEGDEWPFEENSFDVAVSQRGLFYLNNACQVVGNIIQALRPNGIFIADMITHEAGVDNPVIKGRYKNPTPELNMPVYSLSEEHLKMITRDLGATVVEYDGFSANERFSFDREVSLYTWVIKKDGPK